MLLFLLCLCSMAAGNGLDFGNRAERRERLNSMHHHDDNDHREHKMHEYRDRPHKGESIVVTNEYPGTMHHDDSNLHDEDSVQDHPKVVIGTSDTGNTYEDAIDDDLSFHNGHEGILSQLMANESSRFAEVPTEIKGTPPNYAYPNETYVSGDNTMSGRTNIQQVKINQLLEDGKPIDNANPSNMYNALVSIGHSKPVASGVADEIRNANIDKEMRLKRVRELSEPEISPSYVSQLDLARFKNSKDAISGFERDMFVRMAFESRLAKMDSVERSKFEAFLASKYTSSYNAGLARGLPAKVAHDEAMNDVDLAYQHAARAAAISGGGQRVAKLAADKIQIEEESANKIANSPPGIRSELISEKIKEMNAKSLESTVDFSNDLKKMHIEEPIERAHQKLERASALKEEAYEEAIMHPVVSEKILRDIADVGMMDLSKAQSDLKIIEDHRSRISNGVNALDLLYNVNNQKAIDQVNKINELKEKNAIAAQRDADEKNALKAAEERLALAKESQIISQDGEKKFKEVFRRTGDVIEAGRARDEAERETRNRLSKERELRRREVEKMFSSRNIEMSSSIKEAIEHMATAHAGLNEVGDSLEDLNKKYIEAEKRKTNIEELQKETLTPVKVKEVIPSNVSSVGILDGRMELPLKGFSSEEPKTEEEAIVQRIQMKRRDQARNRVIETPIETGLNVIETEDGYTHISEAAEKMDISKGKVFYPKNAKGLMEKQGLDTSLLNHRFNTGERTDIDKGVEYYEADASGFSLDLPSPLDPIPTSVITNGKTSLDIGHASEIQIDEGVLIQKPWDEFVKDVRPSVNEGHLQEAQAMDTMHRKSVIEQENKKKNLEEIDVSVITNPDGAEYVEVVPPYGVAEILPMSQAVASLKSIGTQSVEAVSEETKRHNQSILLDMASNKSQTDVETEFVLDVLSDMEKSGSIDNLSKKNPFNGQIDEKKAKIVDKRVSEMIEESISTSKTIESNVRNNILRNAEQYSKQLGISTQSFIEMVSKVFDSVITQMNVYNQSSIKNRKEVTNTQFYKYITTILPSGTNVDSKKVVKIFLSSIAKETNRPDTVDGEVISTTTVKSDQPIIATRSIPTPDGIRNMVYNLTPKNNAPKPAPGDQPKASIPDNSQILTKFNLNDPNKPLTIPRAKPNTPSTPPTSTTTTAPNTPGSNPPSSTTTINTNKPRGTPNNLVNIFSIPGVPKPNTTTPEESGNPPAANAPPQGTPSNPAGNPPTVNAPGSAQGTPSSNQPSNAPNAPSTNTTPSTLPSTGTPNTTHPGTGTGTNLAPNAPNTPPEGSGNGEKERKHPLTFISSRNP
ncbi:hypothetical protein HK407_12g18070 [Ordospora pajunii]|uniref:uncharacterized protein n=1 Tax=Ordospora pajunii TaxID=3039483 RepID=UPI00295264E2|nr:uncharacterized protein HK407_12g18070 [Ordospora pajunii]KAH9410675.1 hypothetical protein HK407_12g18070 [Ordospora pajunii]